MGLRIVAALSGQLASLGSVCLVLMGARRLDRVCHSMTLPYPLIHGATPLLPLLCSSTSSRP